MIQASEQQDNKEVKKSFFEENAGIKITVILFIAIFLICFLGIIGIIIMSKVQGG